MIKNLKSNWRELVAFIIVNAILFALLMGLGTVKVSESGPLSTFVSLAVSTLGTAQKFATVITLAWFGLAVTFPESARFLLSNRFENTWEHFTEPAKFKITLIAVAVLAIVGALVAASS